MSNWYGDLPGVIGQFETNPNFGTSVVNRHSVVLASVFELSQPQGEPLDYPFQGEAIMTIHNIVPLDDGSVKVAVDTGWTDFPINIRLNFAINPA
jgi:hypothetical protein